MTPFIAEIIGTTLLIILGGGVVANVELNKTIGNNSGWIVVTTGWALAVYVHVRVGTLECAGSYARSIKVATRLRTTVARALGAARDQSPGDQCF